MRTWVLSRFQVYGRVCLTTAIFLSPLIFYRGTADVFNLLKISAMWILGITALGAWLSWSAERRVWVPRFRLLYAAAAFLGACTLATVFSQNPVLSLIGFYHRYGGLIPFALYAVFMMLIVGLYWERPEELKEIARASAGASMLMGAYVLIQAAGLDWIEWFVPGGGKPSFPVGTMGNSNFAGGYLGIGVPFFLYVALTAKHNISKIFLTLLVGLDVLAVWYTQTRGGMIAAGAGLFTMAFMYRDRLPRWSKAVVLSVLAGAVVVVVMVLWHPGSDRPPGLLAKAQTFRTDTFTIRTYYWSAAWRIFLDHPVMGTGLDTYYFNYPKYRLPADGARLGLEITDKPHNIYLEYAANGGILAAGTYLALIGLALWYGYRRVRSLEGQERLLLVTFIAVLVGYAAQGAVSIDVPPLAVMGWVGLGGIVALADPRVVSARAQMAAAAQQQDRFRKKKDRTNSRPNRYADEHLGSSLWPVHATVVLATIGLLVLGTRPLLADAKAKSGETKQIVRAPLDSVASDYRQAIKLFPLEPTYYALAGSLTLDEARKTSDRTNRKRLLDRALVLSREAYSLQPESIFLMTNTAGVYTVLGETIDAKWFSEADRWWAKAIAYDATDWEVHYRYAGFLNIWANALGGDPAIHRRSAKVLEKVTRMSPRRVSPWVNLGRIYMGLGESEKSRDALLQALRLEPDNQEAKQLLAAS